MEVDKRSRWWNIVDAFERFLNRLVDDRSRCYDWLSILINIMLCWEEWHYYEWRFNFMMDLNWRSLSWSGLRISLLVGKIERSSSRIRKRGGGRGMKQKMEVRVGIRIIRLLWQTLTRLVSLRISSFIYPRIKTFFTILYVCRFRLVSTSAMLRVPRIHCIVWISPLSYEPRRWATVGRKRY